MNPFTVCVFALVSVSVIAGLKRVNPHISELAMAVAGILIFIYIAKGLSPFIDFVKKSFDESGLGGYFAILLKALAISLLCRMSAEICRDCGEGALAEKVELAGKIGIVFISMPLIQQLLNLAKDMMK
jgi:stage III sporulation protein AD